MTRRRSREEKDRSRGGDEGGGGGGGRGRGTRERVCVCYNSVIMVRYLLVCMVYPMVCLSSNFSDLRLEAVMC